MTRLGFILVAASLIAFVTRKQLPNAFLTNGVRREQDEKLPLACAGSGIELQTVLIVHFAQL
jgi:hypothetical protein